MEIHKNWIETFGENEISQPDYQLDEEWSIQNERQKFSKHNWNIG